MVPTTHRPERRRTSAQQVLRGRTATAFFAGLRRPLQKALDVLGRRPEALGGSTWHRLLRRLEPGRPEFEALAGLDLQSHYPHLKAGRYDAYVEALRQEGRALAARGAAEEDVVAALSFQLENALAQLSGRDMDERALALVRLTGAMQRFILAGYTEDRAVGWRRLDEQERLKLSRDLHDEVGADLVVLKLYIEMILLELTRGNIAPIGAKLQEAMDLVSRTIESVRRLTLDLGPAILDQIGFLPAVRLYSRQFGSRTGIRIEVRESDLPKEIPSTHEVALYRVLQGALSNVAKHASAKNVAITLGGIRNAVIVMIIEDDGVGFDVSGQPPMGAFGLTAMRDRMQGLGGRLHIEARAGRSGARRFGTRIEIDLPVKGGDA